MNCAWYEQVGKLRKLNPEQISTAISTGFRLNKGETPSSEEIASWKASLPWLIEHIPASLDDSWLMFEYTMPIGNERVDAILLGDGKHAVVFELKSWRNPVKEHGGKQLYVETSGDIRTNPLYQVKGYVGKLKNFHSVASSYQAIYPCVVFDKLNSTQSELTNQTYPDVSIFYYDTAVQLKQWLLETFKPEVTSEKKVEAFSNGKYRASLETSSKVA